MMMILTREDMILTVTMSLILCIGAAWEDFDGMMNGEGL